VPDNVGWHFICNVSYIVMENPAVYLGAIGTALPPCKIEQQEAARLSQLHYKDALSARSMDLLLQVLSHPSIRSRHFAVDRPEDITILKTEDPDARMGRFTRWAIELASTAAKKALEASGVRPVEVSMVAVNTCTGYICPGISTYLIETLGLRPDVKAFDLVGSGCGGALPNLQLGEAHVRQRRGTVALCIAVEICSATYQMDNDPSLIISNAIFGDGAAAAILWDRPEGARLAASASRYVPGFRDDVRYVYKKGQLHNRITPQLPKIIVKQVPDFLRAFIQREGLVTADIRHWALHPGGDKMVNGLQEALRLSDAQVAPTRSVLKELGNMSSPTVLFIADRMHRGDAGRAGWSVLCAYGAGLSMHAYLLKG
jgi:predicted naringenin-chalcone synthase